MSAAPVTLEQEPSDEAGGGVPNVRLNTLKPAWRSWGGFAVAMAVLAGIAALVSQDPYYRTLATAALLFAGLAVAWNILGGYAGQFSLAHAVFFAIGAYSVSLLLVNKGWPWYVGLLIGIAICVVVAALVSWPLFRLRGPFFAIGTLALAEVAFALAYFFEWTGGTQGVQIPFLERPITDQNVWVAIFFGFMGFCLAVSLWVIRSRLGYYLVATRDDEDAASASGANPLLVKTIAFMISAALTGLGGGLFVLYVGFLDPPSFLSALEVGAYIPLLALIGGIGTLVGPVIGAFLLQPGEAYLRGLLAGGTPGVSRVIVGLLLILVALYFREGIWGKFTQFARRYNLARIFPKRGRSDD
jgi:branched-chain amino acid transport system permease protein